MRGAIVTLLVSGLAVGCNYTKEKDPPPPVEVPANYSEGAEIPPPPEPKAEPVRDVRWWRSMSDPTLTALIEEALRRNQSVKAGWARVRQARFIANQVRAARMPQIGLAGDYSIGKSIQPFGKVRSQGASGSLPVSYEVDLFARRAREHQGAKLDAQAARLDQEALAIAISAEVAEAWFDSVNSRVEVAVVTQQLDTDLKFLELVELRYTMYSDPDTRKALTDVFANSFGGGDSREYQLQVEQIREIRTPTLVLWTEKNPGAGPEVGKYLTSVIPGAQFYCMADAAHWPQWEHPEEHDEVVLKFLRGESLS